MGVAIAAELLSQGAEVTLVLGPVSIKIENNFRIINVRSAAEMFDACINNSTNQDIIVMCAAVADFTPASVATEKIKKKDGQLHLDLVKTRDILKALGEIKKEDQVLVGFALETSNEKENAIEKLKSKNADIIVLNSLRDEAAGFGFDTNKISIFDKNGAFEEFETKTKTEAATDIVNKIIRSFYE
jgi:phosphopantothenoylcysteine decarboxylase/phosphopantothenate--cysteine ligase